MKLFRVTYRLRSAVASEWQADTIWGHLCWALRYLHGEHRLAEFIAAYDTPQPPLLVSNGFPHDLLPRPILPPAPLDLKAELAEQKKQFREQKEAKKEDYVSFEEFNRALRGETVCPSSRAEVTRRVTLKNQINRITNTTGAEGGALYSFEEYYCDAITIYAKIAEGFEDTTRELFDYLAKTGYGKRKSVGYGWLEMLDFEPFSGFPSPKDANAFVSLSNFVPAANDPAQGYWKLLVKYGKLGEEYASSAKPFKKPLLMFAAGSAFYDSPVRDYYGRLIPKLSPSHPEVFQYGFGLPVPARLAGE